MNKKNLKIFLSFSLSCIAGCSTEDTINMTAKELAQEQLSKPYLCGGIWDKNFLHKHPEISNKLTQYKEGRLCKSLKDVDTGNLTHQQLSTRLKELGYFCYKKPLSVNSKATPLRYLKKDGGDTANLNELDVVWQEICVEIKDGCVVRIKMDGYPRSKRPAPHSTKAILLNRAQDPSNYDNEAFKVTSTGIPVPKGPDASFGLSPCPYENGKACEAWISEIMAAAHPYLKRTQ
ncbi:hypothetical protein [Candidatus Paracaedibacter symbiosus]|uniref:hypothetical protein n=1 Tax=Candidatus Paracaedibacter symbiosus TaxID=244582 RepID=UPI000509EA21|nr:hypothetical protein [Candidatus Paracaedibacter symbiosus]